MPILRHLPSICLQNFNLRINELRICCTIIRPVIKMCTVTLLSLQSTHQKLLAESRETGTSLQTFIVLRFSTFYKEVTITDASEFENHPSRFYYPAELFNVHKF